MKQILVIDDEADIRIVTQVSLQITKQWLVLTAGSGEEGIAIATEKQPDAILLDVVMPDVDGLMTLSALKRTPATQGIPVIMLTATGGIVTELEYAELGAQAIVTKPFDPAILGDQIATALHWDQD
ncbi:response regulator [Leptolyngbya sp. KIOST-1]|uniref:response regulator n=1 Tax=Leptolyngbya sp. KIOST-1 TaxID=1229172 RepID=UPI000559F7D8|nr:response regulator [Leptolyngbya sp. KIOST-1]